MDADQKKLITIIGDIHDECGLDILKSICKLPYDETGDIYQVGDLSCEDYSSLPENLKFIRGNHDNHDDCLSHHGYLDDWHYDGKLKILTISGADHNSKYDKYKKDTELSFVDFYNIRKWITKYKINPSVVISHAAPYNYLLYSKLVNNPTKTKTHEQLQAIISDMHQNKTLPKYWIHGHYHKHRENYPFHKVKFISLGIGRSVTIDI